MVLEKGQLWKVWGCWHKFEGSLQHQHPPIPSCAESRFHPVPRFQSEVLRDSWSSRNTRASVSGFGSKEGLGGGPGVNNEESGSCWKAERTTIVFFDFDASVFLNLIWTSSTNIIHQNHPLSVFHCCSFLNRNHSPL